MEKGRERELVWVSSGSDQDLPLLWGFHLQLVVPVVTLGSICCDNTRHLYLPTVMQLYFIKVYNSSSLAAPGFVCARAGPAPSGKNLHGRSALGDKQRPSIDQSSRL